MVGRDRHPSQSFFQLPLGFSLWLANAVFLIFSLNFFGFLWTVKTILAVATTSLIVGILTENVYFIHIHIGIDLLFGSLLYGMGVGILIRVGSSSGGMVIPALMIAKLRNWNPGQVILAVNGCIFLLTSIVIDYKIIFYAVICQFISTKMIDYIYFVKIEKPHIPVFLLRRK